MKISSILRATISAFLLSAAGAKAENGIYPNGVAFAQVAAFEGPAAELGLRLRTGIEAAFNEVNMEGGVHGRVLFLESFNDGYEPDLSITQVQKVIEDGDYIGFIGPVGTPTTLVTQPIASEANMPFIGPFTGAGFLRDSSHGNIFNVRASYNAETEEWMKYLVDIRGMQNIAILYQDDGFGKVGLAGVEAALERRGMSVVASGTYTRNTLEVQDAYATIKASNPEAVVMVGAYAPIAEFIHIARADNFDPTFVNISFVGSMALQRELGPEGEGVIVSQVVPFPLNGSIPAVAQYQQALIKMGKGSELDFTSLEGYLVGRLTIEALRNAGPDLTRENFLEAFRELRTVDLGGLVLEYGAEDNQGSDIVYLSRISATGSFEDLLAVEGLK